jgi:hypothetical protein
MATNKTAWTWFTRFTYTLLQSQIYELIKLLRQPNLYQCKYACTYCCLHTFYFTQCIIMLILYLPIPESLLVSTTFFLWKYNQWGFLCSYFRSFTIVYSVVGWTSTYKVKINATGSSSFIHPCEHNDTFMNPKALHSTYQRLWLSNYLFECHTFSTWFCFDP